MSVIENRRDTQHDAAAPRAVARGWRIAIALLLILGLIRALTLWAHQPLYAYANSYDQVRYTACFDLYPDRPADVPPTQNSPQAPYAQYRFIATDDPMCYWSSELVFQGATAALYALTEAVGGGPLHSVRVIGLLRLAAGAMLAIALTIGFLRRGRPGAALIHAVIVAVVLADPGNTLYLNTFYAEWTALLAAWALFGLLMLWRDQARSRWRFIALALIAFALAASKIQHLLLPFALAVVLVIADRLRLRRISWRSAAILIGALAGLWMQFIQLQRPGQMVDSIRQYNQAHVVFTAFLPMASDRVALLDELGLDRSCEAFSGLRAWQLPDMPDRACPGLSSFTRGTELVTLLRHPDLAARVVWGGVRALDPWLARNIGHVESAEFALIPPTTPSLGHALHAAPPLQAAVLALPLIALVVLVARHGLRRDEPLRDHAALTVVLMVVTLVITVLGDGLADVAKQGHLLVNAALAFAIITIGAAIGAWIERRRSPRRAAPP